MVGTSLIIAGLTFNEAICALLGGKHLSVSAKLTRNFAFLCSPRGVTFLEESNQRTFMLVYLADYTFPFSQSSPAIAHCELRIVSHLRIRGRLSVVNTVADVCGRKHHLKLSDSLLHCNFPRRYVTKAHSGDAAELLLG